MLKVYENENMLMLRTSFFVYILFFHIKYVMNKEDTKKGSKDMKKLNDFGEKIGGAKKDLWAFLNSLTDEEQGDIAKKAKLWKSPNYRAMVKKGTPKEVCFWQNQMRKAVVARPESNTKAYVQFVIAFKADVESCNSIEEIKDFYAGCPGNDDAAGIFSYLQKAALDPKDRRWTYASDETKPFFNGNKVLRYVYGTQKKLIADCELSDFLTDKAEKEDKKYRIVEAAANNISSEIRTDGAFKNSVSTETALIVYYDTKDYSELVKQSDNNTLYIASYENRRIGVGLTREDAEELISDVKMKKSAEVKKKETFLPPHLSTIERTGSNYDFFRFTDGNILKARYGLRGGEFGNYTTSKDRLGSINMAYDAFEDLFTAMGISHKDISLGGELAIAFGARGRGNAMAHYEPLKNVINMTKKRGAGSLAHEWGHALDAYLAKKTGLHRFMSENTTSDKMLDSMRELINSFKEQNGKETAFYTASKSFDKSYKKADNGYWSSMPEMFARAFACYIKDKIGDRKSDYLVGHSECATDGIQIAYPVGEERKVIDANFDALIAEMLSLGYFSEEKKKTENKQDEDSEIIDIDTMIYEGESGQMMLFCC